MPLCLELITQPGKHCTLFCIILAVICYTHSSFTCPPAHTHTHTPHSHNRMHSYMVKLKAKLGMLKCEFYWIRLD